MDRGRGVYGFQHTEEGGYYPPETVAQGVWAAGLYAEYSYYRVIRPDLIARKRQLSSVFDDPKSPHNCVSYQERERDKAYLAELEAEEAKRPPPPGAPGVLSKSEVARLIRPECPAEVAKAKSELEDVIDWDEFRYWDQLLSFVYWLFGPPIAVLIAGTSLIWAFRWALHGFRGS